MRWMIVLLLGIPVACTPAFGTPPSQVLHTPSIVSALPTATETPVPPPTASSPPSPTPLPTLISTSVTDFPNPAEYEWQPVASGFQKPLDLQHAGDGSERLFIVEQHGVIRLLQNGVVHEQPFLDIRDRVFDRGNEQGLLGLAFHPEFERNGFFYVNYTGQKGRTVIARFQASGNIADPGSEMRLLQVDQPYANHNGGGLAFGPDGYLYIALGDGGSGGDPLGNGQNPKTLLGALLRIDVNHGDLYSIPADNPFGNEVFHYGLRNPWRFSFDPLTGDMWIADVGQGSWEEVNFLPAHTPGGVNFGWNIFEGKHPYNGGAIPASYQPPLFEYDHTQGCSVTGGYVYRGAMPEWQGVYFYGDYCSGKVWGALRHVTDTEETAISTVLFDTGALIASFGIDEAGEVYLVDHRGTILRLSRR